VQTVRGNMLVKFEVCTFNFLDLLELPVVCAQTDRQTDRRRIERKHFHSVHLAEINE